LIPIESGLFVYVQILFELNKVAWICKFEIAILAKFLIDQAVVPTLWYMHVYQVVKLSLWEHLDIVNLS